MGRKAKAPAVKVEPALSAKDEPAVEGGVTASSAGGSETVPKLVLANGSAEIEQALAKPEPGAEGAEPGVKAEPEASVKREASEPGAVVQHEAKEEEAKKEKKVKKEKREKENKETEKGEDGKGENAHQNEDPEKVTVDSETEYPDLDVSASPTTLYARHSGNSKIDGKYDRLPQTCRGKPCYVKRGDGEKKHVYLFWFKKREKSGMWNLCYEFGSSKFLGRVRGLGTDADFLPPCEPYPQPWEFIQKTDDHKENLVRPSFRLIDGAYWDQSVHSMESLLAMEPVVSSRGVEKKQKTKHKPVESPSKVRARAQKEGVAASRGAVRAARPPAAPGGDDPVTAADDDDDDDEAQPEPAAAKSENSASESESDSDDSSSSASASLSQPSPQAKVEPPAAPATAPPAAPAAAPAPPPALVLSENSAEERYRKKQNFIEKLRDQLAGLKEIKDRMKKWTQVKDMLKEKQEHLLKVAGMGPSEIQDLIKNLEREFQLKAKPKPPQGPPPKSLLEGKGRRGPDASGAVHEENEEGVDVLQHRIPHQTTSALKRRNGFGQYAQPPVPYQRIQWTDVTGQGEVRREVPVYSFKGCGEQLWYQMPGAIVNCDHCEKGVPQSMGSLSGEPNRPQFAQNMFLCHECYTQQASLSAMGYMEGAVPQQ